MEPQSLRRIMVLGHTGFVGKHLMESLRVDARFRDIEVLGGSPPALDLADRRSLHSLSKSLDVHTTIILCAAVKRQFGDNQTNCLHNIHIVANICELLQEFPVGRLIYFSSAAVYGEDVHNLAIDEDTSVKPRSYYGIAKITSEYLLRKAFEAQPDHSLVILRPPLIYGPGDAGETYGPSGFLRKALRQERIVLWGDGEERRGFVYISDVVALVTELIQHDFSGILNLADAESYTFAEALALVGGAVPGGVQFSERPRTKDKVDNVFRNGRLKELFPRFSFTSLQKGIERMYESYKRGGAI